MSRKHTIVHIVSFIAIVIGLFSPILSLPVIAEDTLPAPQVTLETGDGTAVPLNTEDEGDTDESTEPEGEGGDGESTEPKGEGAGDESTSPEGEGEAEEPTEPESETGDPVIPEPEGEGKPKTLPKRPTATSPTRT